jgi:zinc/manganese transport system permease protein
MIFASGVFASAPVHTALIIAGAAAIISAAIGVFTIIRGQSFAGHALADISSTGGAAAFLLGLSPLLGFLGIAVIAAAALEFVSGRRAAERDLATGIVLGAGLGVTALLLYLGVTWHSTTGAAITVLFGSMFAIPASILPLSLAIFLAGLAVLAIIYRPLLLSSLNPDLAIVRGVPVRLIGLLHLAILSLAVTLSAMTIGAILSTALLIGPAAAALRIATRPVTAIALAVTFGLISCWGGILLAYESYNWTPGHIWPVSFFITAIIFAIYLLSSLAPWPSAKPARS